MSSVCRVGFWAIVLSLAVVVPAAAQDDGGDFTVAYQSQQITCSRCSPMRFPVGLELDLATKITGHWSVVGQFDWSRKTFIKGTNDIKASNERLTTYGGGVRWNTLASRVTPFAQALVGITRDIVNLPENNQRTSKLLLDVDGGVAVPITGEKTLSVVAAVGYRRVNQANPLKIVRVLVGFRYNID